MCWLKSTETKNYTRLAYKANIQKHHSRMKNVFSFDVFVFMTNSALSVRTPQQNPADSANATTFLEGSPDLLWV